MRGSSAKTQLRDMRGRFVKKEEGRFTKLTGFSMVYPPKRISRWSTFKRLLSHHRVPIIGYTLYVVVCLAAGAAGGYCGSKIALH